MTNVIESIRKRARASTSALRGHLAGIQLLLDPNKLGEVFMLDDAIPDQIEVLTKVAGAMRAHPQGAAALASRPRLLLDIGALRAMPEGSFGRAVARYFDDNKLDPKAIPTLASDDELSWVKAHLYETHDLWHVATGFGTDVAGELALQAFYAAQLPSRLPEILLAGGLLQAAFRARDDYRRRLALIVEGWQRGVEAEPLFGAPWDTMWGLPLAEVRARLRLGGRSAAS
jgi:ubiquinone biosynthesis protein Coq4